WTLRMNDIHDAWTPQFVSQWKKDDPRRVMAAIADVSSLNDRRRLWSLVDFEHPDVEPRIVAIIEEVLRNYPVDGVDLDFLRAPFYFRSTYEGKPATDKQMGILTRLVERIRKTVLAESERQGKPFLLAARVPVTKELCRYMGIDIATWLPAGLIDVLTIGGGYVVFDQPVAGLIDLGQKHSVPVYPCLSLSGLLHRPPRGNGFALPPAAWYTAAERCFDAGAAGIHCFNLFPGPYNGWKSFDGTGSADAQHDHARAILSRVGSPDTLRAADKLYAISDAGNYMSAHYWSKDAEEFSIALPVELKKNKATLLPDLVVGKHFTVPDGAKVELRIDVSGLAADLPLSVTFNSTQLGEATNVNAVAEVRRHSYAVPAAVIRPGVNRVALTVPVEGARTTGTELWVRRL
ncbi:MAG: hypothetical protein O3B86_20340, partial [Planctomycetota bacterium]|nr:hypothetical protein [Planctomycetota bacterium]